MRDELLPPPKRKDADVEVEDLPAKKIRIPNVTRIQNNIQKLLKFSTFEPKHQYWLNTGYRVLNKVLGSRTLGIPYDAIIEVAGIKHSGKTLLCTWLAGLAQKEGAGIIYVDIENSYDPLWASRLGLNPAGVVLIKPKLIVAKKKSAMPRLESGQAMFQEAETAMYLLHEDGFKKKVVIIDSIAMIRTEKQLDAGRMGQNMNTGLDRARFLSDTLPEWAGLAANYNTMVLLINQMRHKQGIVFGDPLTAPGGDALQHACRVQVRMRPCKAGRLLYKGMTVGIIGVIKNIKNKAGGGSIQDRRCGFVMKFKTTPATIEFMTQEVAEQRIKA